MKTYTLKGKDNRLDVKFTVGDLIPIKHKKNCGFAKLTTLINYSNFHPSLEDFSQDYRILYSQPENSNTDFFLIQNTNIVIIPGNTINPTTLKKEDVENDNF